MTLPKTVNDFKSSSAVIEKLWLEFKTAKVMHRRRAVSYGHLDSIVKVCSRPEVAGDVSSGQDVNFIQRYHRVNFEFASSSSSFFQNRKRPNS